MRNTFVLSRLSYEQAFTLNMNLVSFRKDLYASSIEYLFTSWTTALKPKDGFLRLLEGGCEEIAENGVRIRVLYCGY